MKKEIELLHKVLKASESHNWRVNSDEENPFEEIRKFLNKEPKKLSVEEFEELINQEAREDRYWSLDKWIQAVEERWPEVKIVKDEWEFTSPKDLVALYNTKHPYETVVGAWNAIEKEGFIKQRVK